MAFHPNDLREWLGKRGYSPQKPIRRPRQRNPQVIDAWLGQAYPAIKKSRRRESPPRPDRRDGAFPQPAGTAELVAHRGHAGGRRGRGTPDDGVGHRGVSVSPTAQRLGFYFATEVGGDFSAEKVVTFLRDLLKHLRGKVVVIWDGGPNHQGPVIREFLRKNKRLRLERLPPYASGLNPVEAVWSWLKWGRLANFVPDDLATLDDWIVEDLVELTHTPELLRALWERSDLPFPDPPPDKE